jgi:hypothetical protein
VASFAIGADGTIWYLTAYGEVLKLPGVQEKIYMMNATQTSTSDPNYAASNPTSWNGQSYAALAQETCSQTTTDVNQSWTADFIQKIGQNNGWTVHEVQLLTASATPKSLEGAYVTIGGLECGKLPDLIESVG